MYEDNKQFHSRRRRAQPTLSFLLGSAKNKEAKSFGTGQNPCGGAAAASFLFAGLRFLGAGGHTALGISRLSSAFGVTSLSSSAAFFSSALLVRTGASSGNSPSNRKNSTPITEEDKSSAPKFLEPEFEFKCENYPSPPRNFIINCNIKVSSGDGGGANYSWRELPTTAISIYTFIY
ncbi:hypothetical protein KSP39_PZI023155 [Platanthera zijinensis]|uniref:Uncharacterized protein n=1 Tax=Platanthera zijinensis TaxID=2320716 RepID=A0AAP0AVW3_9ASPA